MTKAGTLITVALVAGATAAAQAQPTPVTPPQPTVPEIFTAMGEFVRVAYNSEGFATLGYRMAQQEIGKEWMLLQVGITLRKPTKDYRVKRQDLSIRTPDGKTIPLATQKEYAAANLTALNNRLRVIHDSINYFPVDASRPCALQFFADLGGPGPTFAYEETELSSDRACLGRLYFRVPGGIQVGQHWLDIRFAGSTVEVPFRTLTNEEEKEFRERWQEIKKQHDATFKH
jgi:hypothetical protein